MKKVQFVPAYRQSNSTTNELAAAYFTTYSCIWCFPSMVDDSQALSPLPRAILSCISPSCFDVWIRWTSWSLCNAI